MNEKERLLTEQAEVDDLPTRKGAEGLHFDE
jgi:hypothetical protein